VANSSPRQSRLPDARQVKTTLGAAVAERILGEERASAERVAGTWDGAVRAGLAAKHG